jgi:phosphatidylethanolamine/phosphatidyl-N-methylethanolamine N-methyltransferase
MAAVSFFRRSGIVEQIHPDMSTRRWRSRLTFFRQWLKNPRGMASIVPSSRQLANLMVAATPVSASHIVELGAGTGAITEALLRRGAPSQQVLAIEMNPVLHQVLSRRFPELHLANGDARDLAALVAGNDTFACGKVDAVLSSLGLLTMPKNVQRDIVLAAFDVLHPAGVFVQYTYGLVSPLGKEMRTRLGLRCVSAGLAWRNLPPARVFVYTRD